METKEKVVNQEPVDGFSEVFGKIYDGAIGIGVLIILAIFPLYYRDYYYDILVAKYTFYYVTMLGLFGVLLLISAAAVIIDGKEYGFSHTKGFFSNFSKKKIRDHVLITDWFLLAFLLVGVISTLQSDYVYESFWGNEGRYMGMFLLLLYGASYFIISRCLKFRRWYLDVFLAAGLVVCGIGILHFFQIDPIGFKEGLTERDYKMFTSTIGNINTYTSYVALISGMSVVLFVSAENGKRKIWYGINVVVSLFALITGISDNAYLALMALFGLLPLYLFNSLAGVKKYVLMVAVLFTEFQFIDGIIQAYPAGVMEISGLFEVIVGYDKLGLVVAALWALTVILYVADAKLPQTSFAKKESNTGRWIWLGVIILVILGVGYAIYDANINGNAERYGALQGYLVINDDWGTHRWYIWRIGMESYGKFPLIHKIFGYGPDTFGIITVTNYYEEMVQRYGEKFDSAHNEYLQYLITIGIAGLAAYLSLLVTSIAAMIRKAKKVPFLMGIPFALICYGAQAAVNISVPIVAPVMMTLLMVGVASVNGAGDTA